MSRGTYRVKAIFGPTIQGEGTHAGTVVSFVRFAGCNRWTGLAKDKELSFCKFCDTDFRDGSPKTVLEILAELERLGPKVVVLSGGEPTLQVDEDLLVALIHHGYKIHLETNGSRDIGELAGYFDHITVSPKQPRAETKLRAAHAIKLLHPLTVPGMQPEDFADYPATERFLQAVWEPGVYENNLRATICRLYGLKTWRLSLQTHKIIGVE